MTDSEKVIEVMRKRVEPGYIVHVKNIEEGCEVVNAIAPEHVEVMTRKAEAVAKKIVNAGSVFVGPYSPAVVGDYVAGPSHVLPTGGTAHYFSALSASDFVKSTQVISYTREALQKERQHVKLLTEIEGLVLHRISMEARFHDGQKQNAKSLETQDAKS